MATLGIRRESRQETTLQSWSIPLGYQGLVISGQVVEGLGKKMVIELGGGGVNSCSLRLPLPGA